MYLRPASLLCWRAALRGVALRWDLLANDVKQLEEARFASSKYFGCVKGGAVENDRTLFCLIGFEYLLGMNAQKYARIRAYFRFSCWMWRCPGGSL